MEAHHSIWLWSQSQLSDDEAFFFLASSLKDKNKILASWTLIRKLVRVSFQLHSNIISLVAVCWELFAVFGAKYMAHAISFLPLFSTARKSESSYTLQIEHVSALFLVSWLY